MVVKLLSLGMLALLVAPAYAPAASRDIEELQRDVGLLQEQVRTLQNSQNEKLAALTALVQQALDAATKANTSAAVIQNGFQQNLKDQENKVVAPVVGLATRMDQMSMDFRTLQGAVTDLTSLASKLQAQLTDLNNAVKVLQAPPAAPPPAPLGAGGTGPNAAADTCSIPASQLYTDAQRDRTGGNLDLAVNEFTEYLRCYGNTDLAPNAQFYIAYIHYSNRDYDNAVREFDMVLEKYPENNKIADSLYYKGMTLVRMGKRTQGAQEFKQLLKQFPNHDLSRQACSQLTTMGLKCTVTRTSAPARRQ
jgi:TolA-binding protein